MSHMEYYFENFEALTKLVVEIPEPLATQQFFTGPQVIGTSWYNNPESLAKARINILMWRAIQLYNLPQQKVRKFVTTRQREPVTIFEIVLVETIPMVTTHGSCGDILIVRYLATSKSGMALPFRMHFTI